VDVRYQYRAGGGKRVRRLVRLIRRFATTLWLSLAALILDGSPEASAADILVRNVSLIDAGGPSQARTVNIFIRDGRLDLVSEDPIPVDAAIQQYEAANGVVLGRLVPGEPANFLILDGDPREDVEILLDTRQHATFAVSEGEILRNRLDTSAADTYEDGGRAGSGWMAYAPPPLAVPLNYADSARWNRFDSRYVSGIFAAAVILDRTRFLEQDNSSKAQVGDLDVFDGGEIRGLRFGAVGTINLQRPWVWTVFGATNAFSKGFDTQKTDDFSWFDWRLDIPVGDRLNFSVGKQKEPISMERTMSLVNSPMQERAAVSDALLPSRNVGVVMSGTLFDERATWAGGLFNDWLDQNQPDSFDDNASQFAGRATWVPFESPGQSTLLHLGLGYRYSNAREDGGTATGPEFNQAPDYVAANFTDLDSLETYQAETSLRSGPFWLHAEWLQTIAEPDTGEKETLDGYHVTASWILTGEVRSYNKKIGIFGKVPIARTVNHNGWGAWEIGARFSHLDLSENTGDLTYPDFPLQDGGKLDIWSASINWWLSPYFNVNLNYRYINLDRYGIEGNSQAINSRVTLMLE
jgi:phosphate-selective porin OprO/OprP